MMDAITYGAVPVENIGWMSEAHRLSLGANRSRKGSTAASNANRLSQIALATCPQIKIARTPILQAVVRWLATSQINGGVHHSTT
jgi:hypothetical protein